MKAGGRMSKALKIQRDIFNELESMDDFTRLWGDWYWHMKHAIKDIELVESLLGIAIDKEEKNLIKQVIQKYPLSITPYYLSLIDIENYSCDPIFMQAFPSVKELISYHYEMQDPLVEDIENPAPGITHRYPDRILFQITNRCAMYCRHCTRKRKNRDEVSALNKEKLKAGLEYIRKTPEIRDVLLSGGDPFMLSDEDLEWILDEIQAIPHVEIIRIGTRMPVVLPFRITGNLTQILKKYPSLWINTHFNHPRELTSEAQEALRKLSESGIPLGNQTVLLAGINDNPAVIKNLCHLLVRNRIRPYYLYQCDLSEGLSHFRTPIDKGVAIIKSMIGNTTGFAIPRFVVDAPGGKGKIPIMPDYIISKSEKEITLRTYQGKVISYPLISVD